MTMDDQTVELLNRMHASHVPPVYRLTVEQARSDMQKSSQMLGPPTLGVGEVLDMWIPVESGKIRLRRYSPPLAGSGADRPVLLMYHGGGFVLGDVDTHDSIARAYCLKVGAVVVSVDYRRAPEHRFPCAVEDSYAALCWTANHAGKWGADPGRIAVTGDSAGGNLAAAVCQLARSREGPEIAYQALVYPIVEQSLEADYGSRREFGGEGQFLSLRDMEWFAAHYLGRTHSGISDPRASPIRAESLQGLPPALVLTAGFDPLRDEGRHYADRLSGAGVRTEYKCFAGTIHGFLSFAGVLEVGRQALDFVAARLGEALARQEEAANRESSLCIE